jgi:hypothetical protein
MPLTLFCEPNPQQSFAGVEAQYFRPKRIQSALACSFAALLISQRQPVA